MKALFEILSSSNNFSSVYLIQSHKNLNLNIEQFNQWFSLFFLSFQDKFSTKKIERFINSPDLLVISKSEKQKNYKVEDFHEIFQFQETAPMYLTNKFCIIHEAELITEQAFNKLLKVFEEPLNNLVFFLFTNSSSKFISTIESRISRMRLSSEDIAKFEPIHDQKQEIPMLKSLTEFQKSYKDIPNENEFIKNVLSMVSDSELTNIKKEVPEFLKWFQESKNFNNAKSERAFFVFQILKTIQLNRKDLR